MSSLSFITDQSLFACVDALLMKANAAQADAVKKFNKNVIDPFSPLFEMGGFNVPHKQWVKSELTRQSQKSVSNSVGVFHQSILGSVDNWEDLGTGGQVDLVNHEKQIIAEVKNKYNTVKGSDLKNVYNELDDLISRKASAYKDYKAYFVSIIPSRPTLYDIPFTPSDKERGKPCPENQNIRKIEGASFYHLVTGIEDALEQLFLALPKVIEARSKSLGYEFKQFSKQDEGALRDYFTLAYGSNQ